MYFRNEHHRQAFCEGMKKTNRKDRETVSAVYLLSAEPCLWRRAKQASVCGINKTYRYFTNNAKITTSQTKSSGMIDIRYDAFYFL